MAKATPIASIAVIGGGVIGLSVALRLAQDGRDVVLVAPRGRQEASEAAGAMLGVFSELILDEDPTVSNVNLTERIAARRMYDSWYETLTDESPTAGLFVIANPDGDDDRVGLDFIREAAITHGEDVQSAAACDIEGLTPERTHPILDALWLPGEGSVNAPLLLAALWRAVHANPSITHLEASVTKLADGDMLAIHLDNESVLHAEAAVLCSGVNTSRIAHASTSLELGIPPLFSGRGVSLVLRSNLKFPHTVRTPNRAFACGLHAVPRDTNSLYIGATNRLSTSPETERDATLSEIGFLMDGAQRQFNPLLRDAELTAVHVGHRPVTIDRLPLIGKTQDARVYLATGTYRNGILLAPRIAELISAAVDGDLDHPYSPLRDMPGDDILELTGRASRSIVTSLTSGDGRLAPGRRDDLEQFVAASLSHMLSNGERDPLLPRFIARMQERAPMEEVLPLLFDAVARKGK